MTSRTTPMIEQRRGRSKRPAATRAASPARRVATFVAKFDPRVASLARTARAVLHKRFPAAIELVYDNDNALASGFGTTRRVSDVFVSLAVYARGVNRYFMHPRRQR